MLKVLLATAGFEMAQCIGGATTSSYTLVAADIGQSITFEVTPVASIGKATGNPVTSAAFMVNSPPTATGVSFTDANGAMLSGQ